MRDLEEYLNPSQDPTSGLEQVVRAVAWNVVNGFDIGREDKIARVESAVANALCTAPTALLNGGRDWKPIVAERFADNGAHSHFDLVDPRTGETLIEDLQAHTGELPQAPAVQAPVVPSIDMKALFLEFSDQLHRLPNLDNGHQIGMMEIDFGNNGKIEYGPFWMSKYETDKIVLNFLETRHLLTHGYQAPGFSREQMREAMKGAVEEYVRYINSGGITHVTSIEEYLATLTPEVKP